MAGNSLDGNGNGQAEGPESFYSLNSPENRAVGDSAQFAFWTSDDILLTGPAITTTRPATTAFTATRGAAIGRPIEMEFDHAMALTSLNSRNLNIAGSDQITGAGWDTWWTVEGENAAPRADLRFGSGLARILHGGLWEESDFAASAESRARDLYQNCYFPSAGRGIEPGAQECAADEDQPYCCNGAPSASACEF